MSQRMDVKSDIKKYLKQCFLEFHEDVYEDTDRITLIYKGCEKLPDHIVESCIYFYPDYMECRVYYSVTGAEWCADSTNQSELMRLMNYINARVWPCGSYGVD